MFATAMIDPCSLFALMMLASCSWARSCSKRLRTTRKPQRWSSRALWTD